MDGVSPRLESFSPPPSLGYGYATVLPGASGGGSVGGSAASAQGGLGNGGHSGSNNTSHDMSTHSAVPTPLDTSFVSHASGSGVGGPGRFAIPSALPNAAMAGSGGGGMYAVHRTGTPVFATAIASASRLPPPTSPSVLNPLPMLPAPPAAAGFAAFAHASGAFGDAAAVSNAAATGMGADDRMALNGAPSGSGGALGAGLFSLSVDRTLRAYQSCWKEVQRHPQGLNHEEQQQQQAAEAEEELVMQAAAAAAAGQGSGFGAGGTSQLASHFSSMHIVAGSTAGSAFGSIPASASPPPAMADTAVGEREARSYASGTGAGGGSFCGLSSSSSPFGHSVSNPPSLPGSNRNSGNYSTASAVAAAFSTVPSGFALCGTQLAAASAKLSTAAHFLPPSLPVPAGGASGPRSYAAGQPVLALSMGAITQQQQQQQQLLQQQLQQQAKEQAQHAGHPSFGVASHAYAVRPQTPLGAAANGSGAGGPLGSGTAPSTPRSGTPNSVASTFHNGTGSVGLNSSFSLTSTPFHPSTQTGGGGAGGGLSAHQQRPLGPVPFPTSPSSSPYSNSAHGSTLGGRASATGSVMSVQFNSGHGMAAGASAGSACNSVPSSPGPVVFVPSSHPMSAPLPLVLSPAARVEPGHTARQQQQQQGALEPNASMSDASLPAPGRLLQLQPVPSFGAGGMSASLPQRVGHLADDSSSSPSSLASIFSPFSPQAGAATSGAAAAFASFSGNGNFVPQVQTATAFMQTQQEHSAVPRRGSGAFVLPANSFYPSSVLSSASTTSAIMAVSDGSQLASPPAQLISQAPDEALFVPAATAADAVGTREVAAAFSGASPEMEEDVEMSGTGGAGSLRCSLGPSPASVGFAPMDSQNSTNSTALQQQNFGMQQAMQTHMQQRAQQSSQVLHGYFDSFSRQQMSGSVASSSSSATSSSPMLQQGAPMSMRQSASGPFAFSNGPVSSASSAAPTPFRTDLYSIQSALSSSAAVPGPVGAPSPARPVPVAASSAADSTLSPSSGMFSVAVAAVQAQAHNSFTVAGRNDVAASFFSVPGGGTFSNGFVYAPKSQSEGGAPPQDQPSPGASSAFRTFSGNTPFNQPVQQPVTQQPQPPTRFSQPAFQQPGQQGGLSAYVPTNRGFVAGPQGPFFAVHVPAGAYARNNQGSRPQN
jgi:hypothetical protein